MRRLLVIANPAASSFTSTGHRRAVSILSRSFDVESVWPTTGHDTRQAAAEAAQAGVEIVVAMGGDGVVHHAANGIVGSNTKLGLIPAGTTNVLARIHAFPTKPAQAARSIVAATDGRAIDVAKVVLDGRRVHYATFATGFGFDAEVVEQAETEPYRKYRFGGLHYARTAVAVLRRRKRPQATVIVGGEKVTASTALVQVSDPYTFFGRLPLRVASADPGHLNVATFARLGLLRASRILRRAIFGSGLEGLKGVRVFGGVDSLAAESEHEMLVQADGELLGSALTIEIAHLPQALVLAKE